PPGRSGSVDPATTEVGEAPPPRPGQVRAALPPPGAGSGTRAAGRRSRPLAPKEEDKKNTARPPTRVPGLRPRKGDGLTRRAGDGVPPPRLRKPTGRLPPKADRRPKTAPAERAPARPGGRRDEAPPPRPPPLPGEGPPPPLRIGRQKPGRDTLAGLLSFSRPLRSASPRPASASRIVFSALLSRHPLSLSLFLYRRGPSLSASPHPPFRGPVSLASPNSYPTSPGRTGTGTKPRDSSRPDGPNSLHPGDRTRGRSAPPRTAQTRSQPAGMRPVASLPSYGQTSPKPPTPPRGPTELHREEAPPQAASYDDAAGGGRHQRPLGGLPQPAATTEDRGSSSGKGRRCRPPPTMTRPEAADNSDPLVDFRRRPRQQVYPAPAEI
ncbi:basic proline-rich protein-like, partial [Camarhynchus parvulus]|uniref:basic proline-rich protein-like n=1 Tax=Geospiza parvula TaxID=87175 RepID=UPI001237A43D